MFMYIICVYTFKIYYLGEIMSNGWVKGQGLFKNLKALNQKQNERARILQEEKEAKRLQSGYDRVSGGDVAYSQTLSGASGGTKYGDLIAPGDTGLKGSFSQLGEPYHPKMRLSTGNIDFEDADQVKRIQRALGVTEDGIFGEETERAYRAAINARRSELGADEYSYNANPLVSAAENDGIVDDGIVDDEVVYPNTFAGKGFESVNQPPNYEGTSRNIVGDAIYEASGGADSDWEDLNFFQKVGQSLPGVGGNPTLGQFWGNMFSKKNK